MNRSRPYLPVDGGWFPLFRRCGCPTSISPPSSFAHFRPFFGDEMVLAKVFPTPHLSTSPTDGSLVALKSRLGICCFGLEFRFSLLFCPFFRSDRYASSTFRAFRANKPSSDERMSFFFPLSTLQGCFRSSLFLSVPVPSGAEGNQPFPPFVSLPLFVQLSVPSRFRYNLLPPLSGVSPSISCNKSPFLF